MIHTIGHSNHPIATLIALLKQHGISVLCDVRSQPSSRWVPQYNRDALKQALNAADITYVFLGKELGARSKNPACYIEGKVQYALLAQQSEFQSGIQRLMYGMQSHRIAIMCAEKDPLHCHRALLVGRHLDANGVPLRHIHADGSIEIQSSFENRLFEAAELTAHDLFNDRESLLADAYARCSGQPAYKIHGADIINRGGQSG